MYILPRLLHPYLLAWIVASYLLSAEFPLTKMLCLHEAERNRPSSEERRPLSGGEEGAVTDENDLG